MAGKTQRNAPIYEHNGKGRRNGKLTNSTETVKDTNPSDDFVFAVQEDTVVRLRFDEKIVKTESELSFVLAEQMPEFEGGMAALGKYLSKHLRYPAAARDRGVAGLVYVQFVVDSRGQVSDVKVLKGIDTACDEEAVRVVSQMPAWKPGRQNGRNVAVRFSLPIRFSVENQ